jgi:flagellar motility protein MotE (MotC chaperone)/DNA-binding XRE family transcriptional regulator
VGQYQTMPERTAEPVLEPRDIQSLADLGRQLRALRLAAPRPDPADDPLTLRDLAELTGVPRSTLGNAESGRILPRTEVVYRVALACGVPAADIPDWTAARNRVARRAGGTRPPRPAAHPPPGRVSAGEPDGVLVQLRGLSLEPTAGQLQRLPVPPVAEYLEGIRSASAAAYLEEMETAFAADCLSHMTIDQAAECLSWMEPSKAGLLLEFEEVALSVAHVRQMRTTAATAAIAGMAADVAAERLNRLSGDVASRITQGLPPKAKRALILAEDLPERLTLELLFGLDYRQTVQLLETATTRQAATLLARMPDDPAAGVLTALRRRSRLALFGQLSPEAGGRLLNELPMVVGIDAVESLPTGLVAAMLAQADMTKAALLLECLPAGRKDAALAAMRSDAAAAVRAALHALPRLVTPGRRAEANWGVPHVPRAALAGAPTGYVRLIARLGWLKPA